MFGEIYICRFPFTSGLLSKPRPAVVLFDLGQDAVIARVTSAAHAGPLDIRIADWQASGLAKASIVRIDRIVTAEKTLLHQKLGTLSSRDAEAVRQAWNQNMRL